MLSLANGFSATGAPAKHTWSYENPSLQQPLLLEESIPAESKWQIGRESEGGEIWNSISQEWRNRYPQDHIYFIRGPVVEKIWAWNKNKVQQDAEPPLFKNEHGCSNICANKNTKAIKHTLLSKNKVRNTGRSCFVLTWSLKYLSKKFQVKMGIIDQNVAFVNSSMVISPFPRSGDFNIFLYGYRSLCHWQHIYIFAEDIKLSREIETAHDVQYLQNGLDRIWVGWDLADAF